MKKSTKNILLFFISTLIIGCNDSNETTEIIEKPTNLIFNISNPNDGSGIVEFIYGATNAVNHEIKYSTTGTQATTNGQTSTSFLSSINNNEITTQYLTSGNYDIVYYAYSQSGQIDSVKLSNILIEINSTNPVDPITPPVVTTPCTNSGLTGNSSGTGSYVLVWADEFNGTGICTDNWNFDLGATGWGNAESQNYTNRLENAKVENGNLIITAKKENYQGASYTSARMKTQDKFEFTYGKIEVRAKLPTMGGTWPAIWTLGANIDQIGWPNCGEIDIMEHVGNNVNRVTATTHTAAANGGGTDVGHYTVNDVKQYHIYSAEWDINSIKFYIDGILYHTYNPTTLTTQNWPFNKDQFILLNIAVGGTLGGAINPNFTQDTMEIDYVRVYQK